MNVTFERITRFVPFEVAGLTVITTVVARTDNQGEPCAQCGAHGRVNDCTVYHDGTTVDCCPWCAPIVALILGQMDPETPVRIEVNPMGFYGTHVVAELLGYGNGYSLDPAERRRAVIIR